jgi:hypothetical protein
MMMLFCLVETDAPKSNSGDNQQPQTDVKPDVQIQIKQEKESQPNTQQIKPPPEKRQKLG